MTRWSICLGAVLFVVACTSDGGPGTESPINAGVGGTGGEGDSGAGGGSGAAGAAAAGSGGSGGVGGAAGAAAGQGGMSGMSGQGGAGGDMAGADGGVPNDDDAGADDEGYCTVACTGIPPDENVVEACGMITTSDDCTMFETGGFPASCRWVTPDSGPCLTP